MSDQIKALASASTCIEDYIATLTKRIEEVKTYRDLQAIAVEFVMTFPEPLPSPDDSYTYSDTRVHISLDQGTVRALMINKDFTNLADVKTPLRWLADRLGKYEIEDTPELGRRSYIFKDGRLRFQCFFSSRDSSVCKFVQVGVEEKPVYKLTCVEPIAA